MVQNIKNLLEKYNVTPNKVLGQNFLINEGVADELIKATCLTKDDTVVEVGPGTGVITKKLAQIAKKVIAVEKDPKLIPILQKELKTFLNIEIINEDILKFNPANYSLQTTCLPDRQAHYSLLGAPPYYLTGRLFRHFLESSPIRPTQIALIIQKNVAQRIVAKPPKSNILATSIQFYGEPSIINIISKNSFWPKPKVDSAILVIKDIKNPTTNEQSFFKIVRAGFSSPRKQLKTNLKQQFNLGTALEIDLSRRAETLTIKEWAYLTEKLR